MHVFESDEPIIKKREYVLDVLLFVILPIIGYLFTFDNGLFIDHQHENARIGLLLAVKYSWPLVPLYLWSLYGLFQKRVPLGRVAQFFHFGGLLSGIFYGFSQMVFLGADSSGNIFINTLLQVPFTIPLLLFYWFVVSISREVTSNWMKVLSVAGWVSFGLLIMAVFSSGFIFMGLFIFLMLTPSFYTLSNIVKLWIDLRSEKVTSKNIVLTALAPSTVMTVAGWQLSLMLSLEKYNTLPQTPPDCYIATAATKGHATFVGSRSYTLPNKKTISVNRQLQMGKLFELYLQARYPLFHKRFRKIYDLVGPELVPLLKNPFMADCAWLLLKPFEWIARVILFCNLKDYTELEKKVYTGTAISTQ